MPMTISMAGVILAEAHTECETAGAELLGGQTTGCARAKGRPVGEDPLAADVEGMI